MINVNQITSELARMPDAALKQYATMHKDDPYTMSLAMSESNRRKQMRDGAQAQGGQQPTVVDQELAQMGGQPLPQQMPQGAAQAMPENTGIGTLPQQPMGKAMAEGGIVAFAGDEGSLVQGEPSIWDKLMRANEKWRGDTGVRRGSQSGQPASLQPVGGSDYSDVANAQNEALLKGAAGTAPNLGADMSAYNAAPSVAPSVAPVAKAAPASPLANLGGAPRVPAAPAGLSFIEQQKKTLAAMGPEVNPEQGAMEQLIAERNKGAETGKAEFESDVKARADQFKNREERIGKREEALGKEKDTNTGLAFLQAGLSMMQARGPALSAIAEGAGVGTKQYASGLKDLKAAQEKLDEARDKTDELKQNQSMMDAKERRSLNSEIRNASLTGQQYMIDARAKIHGENRADARAATASDIAVQQAALERQTKLQVAGMPGDQQKMLTALGGTGGLKAGMEAMAAIQAGKVTPLQMYEKYLQAGVGKDTGLAPQMSAREYMANIQQAMAAQEMLTKPPPLSGSPTGVIRQ